MKSYRRVLGWTVAGLAVIAAGAAAQDAAERLFKLHDRNKDGKLSRDEFPQRVKHLFDRIDTNKDGMLTLDEDRAFRRNRDRDRRARPGRGGGRTPQGVRIERDIDYAGTKNPRQALDLILPVKRASEKPLPVIAFIHGGAWRAGDKRGGIGRVAGFVATGKYAGVSIGYRLSDESIWPAQIHDCKAAIRWLRAHSKKHNLDPGRIAVWGSSAGGHLVAVLGTSGDVKDLEGTVGPHKGVSSRVTCVVDWFGPTDFCRMDAHAIPGSRMKHDPANSPESLLVGGPIQASKDKVARANPITYVTKDDPPFLICHGTKDPLVPVHQSELLDRALKRVGCDVIFVKVVGAGHGGFRSGELDGRVKAFFERHLLGKKVEISAEPVQQQQGPRRR